MAGPDLNSARPAAASAAHSTLNLEKHSGSKLGTCYVISSDDDFRLEGYISSIVAMQPHGAGATR